MSAHVFVRLSIGIRMICKNSLYVNEITLCHITSNTCPSLLFVVTLKYFLTYKILAFILLNLFILFSEKFHTYRKVEIQQIYESLWRSSCGRKPPKMVLNDSHLLVFMPFANTFTKSAFLHLYHH